MLPPPSPLASFQRKLESSGWPVLDSSFRWSDEGVWTVTHPFASFAGLTGESMSPQGAGGQMDPPVKPEGDASGGDAPSRSWATRRGTG